MLPPCFNFKPFQANSVIRSKERKKLFKMFQFVWLFVNFILVGTAIGSRLALIETLTSSDFNDGMIWPTGKIR